MQNKFRSIILQFGLILCILAASAQANDGFGELGLGGVVLDKTDDIAMTTEVLDIAYDGISVEYQFSNQSDKNITSTVSFPLPAFHVINCEAPIIRYPQPSEFKLWVNGQAVSFNTKVTALQNGQDVSAKLKAIGFSEKQIARQSLDDSLFDCTNYVYVIPATQIAALVSSGLDTGSGNSAGHFPDWDVQLTYQWQQVFPAHSTLTIKHHYRPFIAGGTASDFSASGLEDYQAFCLTSAQKAKLQQLEAEKKNLTAYGVHGAIVSYILKTANSWKDGIRDFTLRIHTRQEDEIVALCLEKSLNKVAANLYEAKFSNFHPQQDLRIYFGNAKLGPRELEAKSLGNEPKI